MASGCGAAGLWGHAADGPRDSGAGILTLLCIESDLLHKIDLQKLTDEFAVVKARKVVILLL